MTPHCQILMSPSDISDEHSYVRKIMLRDYVEEYFTRNFFSIVIILQVLEVLVNSKSSLL